jgi:hypothetical protein
MEDWHETDMVDLPVDVPSPGQNGSALSEAAVRVWTQRRHRRADLIGFEYQLLSRLAWV